MIPSYQARYVIDVEVREAVAVEAPATGFRTQVVGTRKETVEVEIDLDKIVRRMGAKAATLKSGRCCDGFVVVRHVRAKR